MIIDVYFIKPAYEVQTQTPSSSVPIQCQNELSFIALPNLSASISQSIKNYINSSTSVKKTDFYIFVLSTWPLNAREAGVDLALKQTCLFIHSNAS